MCEISVVGTDHSLCPDSKQSGDCSRSRQLMETPLATVHCSLQHLGKAESQVGFSEKNPLRVTNTQKPYLAWDVHELKTVGDQESIMECFIYVCTVLRHASQACTFSVSEKRELGLDGLLVQHNTHMGSLVELLCQVSCVTLSPTVLSADSCASTLLTPAAGFG